MAAPVTHIVLANKIFPMYFQDVDKVTFFVGTSFPDIRYLRVIDREKTHVHIENIESISRVNGFEAGVSFHVLVDKIRKQYMIDENVYQAIPQSKFITQALKIYEDHVLCSKIENWEEIAKYFETTYPEEHAFGIEDGKIKEWHSLISEYLSHHPASDETIRRFIINLGFTSDIGNEIVSLVHEIRKVDKVRGYIEDFYTNFEAYL